MKISAPCSGQSLRSTPLVRASFATACQEVAGMQLAAERDVEVGLHRRAPDEDAPVQAVPPSDIYSQGGADIAATTP